MGRTPAGQTRDHVFAFVAERLRSGEPPTVREVQEAFGFRAVQTARAHLEALVDEGRLTIERGKARGYRLGTQHASSGTFETPMLVPLLGRVPAGALNLAVEDLEGYVAVHGRHPAHELFALRVEGESMTGIGIRPGDVVIVRRQPTARSGQVVVALVEDEATVKTLRMRRNRVELHPENPDFEPIVPDDPASVQILGRAIEVRRSLE